MREEKREQVPYFPAGCLVPTSLRDDEWLKVPLFPDISFTPDPSCSISKLQVEEMWKAILRYSWLIPCRANNSMVEERFNTDVSKKHNWDGLAMYIATHSANPEQSNLTNISWIQAIRLMRNILCHETSFSWFGLLEFEKNIISYFGSTEEFDRLLVLYRERCSAPEDINVDVAPVARIQLSSPENCVILPDRTDPSLRPFQKRKVFVGVEHVASFTSKWVNSRKRGESIVSFLVGAPKSGRTTIGKYILPHLLSLRLVEIQCTGALDFTQFRTLVDCVIDKALKSKFLLIDDFESMLISLPVDDQIRLYSLLLDLATRHAIALVGSPLLPIMFDSIKKQANIKSKVQFLVIGTLAPPPTPPHPSAGSPPHAPTRSHYMHATLCDAQVLFRFYNSIEKWGMRKIAMELGCAALTPSHLWQSISLSPTQHVHNVMRSMWDDVSKFVSRYPDETAIFTRLLYPGGIKPKGWCWLPVVEECNGSYGIRCAFLHAILFLYTMKPDLVFTETKISFPSLQPSTFVNSLDLLYLAQLSTIFRFITLPNLETSTNLQPPNFENSTNNTPQTNYDTPTTTKRKMAPNCEDAPQKRMRKFSKFEAEMANFEGFRFGQPRTFVRDLHAIYLALFGEKKTEEEESGEQWTWIMQTLSEIFCRKEIWENRFLDVLVTFVNKVMLFFKEDRDMLRNVIILYKHST